MTTGSGDWFAMIGADLAEVLSSAEHGIVETIGQWTARLGADGQVPSAGAGTEEQLPNVLTHSNAGDVFAALQTAGQLSHDSTLVLLSQWALETGAGASCHCFNLGNAKHVRGDGHLWTMFRCSEVYGGRELFFDPPNPQTWFRAFRSLDAGAADYLALLQRRFSGAWPAVLSGDVAAFGHQLAVEHYQTASEAKYVALLRTLQAQLAKQI